MSAHAQSDQGHGERARAGSQAAGGREARTGWLGDPRRCATADVLLLLLAAATVVMCLLESHGAARLLLVLAAACLIPGSAATHTLARG